MNNEPSRKDRPPVTDELLDNLLRTYGPEWLAQDAAVAADESSSDKLLAKAWQKINNARLPAATQFSVSARRVQAEQDDVLAERAISAIEQAGYPFKLASAGPLDRFAAFFEEELTPQFQAHQAEFRAACDAHYAELCEGCPEFGETVAQELYLAATTLALSEALPNWMPQLNFAAIQPDDWTALARLLLAAHDWQ